MFFQVISETGLIGLGIYIYFYLYLLSNYFKSVEIDPIRRKILSVNCSLIVCLLPLIPQEIYLEVFFS